MPARTWVLDTWLFGVVADGQRPEALPDQRRRARAAISLLHQIEEHEHCVAVDFKGEISAEYSRYIPARSLVQDWWVSMQQLAGRIYLETGDLAGQHAAQLRNRFRFHDDDVKFVGVASRTADRLLVSEDSDYTVEVKEYLKEELGITVLSLEEALELVRDP